MLMWAAPSCPSLRRRVLKAGKIVFHSGNSTVDCTVRGISEVDATLDVVSTADIPVSFKLRIEADDFSRHCRIITKSERRVEVEFQ
jgi:hypothetical protein